MQNGGAMWVPPGGAANGGGKGGWGFVGVGHASSVSAQTQVKDGSQLLSAGKAGNGDGNPMPGQQSKWGQGMNGVRDTKGLAVRVNESLPPQHGGPLSVGVPPQRVSPFDLKRRPRILPPQPGMELGTTNGYVTSGGAANGRTPPKPILSLPVKEEEEGVGVIPWHVLTETPAKPPSVK